MSKIPDEYVELATKMAALAAEYKLFHMEVKFRPGFKATWSEDINMSWDSGRHEADTKKFQLQSTIWHREDHQ